jgi:hypothetical protein
MRAGGFRGGGATHLPFFLLAALVLLLAWEIIDYRVIRQDRDGHRTPMAGSALGMGRQPLRGG